MKNIKIKNQHILFENKNNHKKISTFAYITLIIIATLVVIFVISTYIDAAEKKEGIENFPDSYKPYLLELKKKYPNWHFVALYTNLDWKYVIDNENIFGKNLVPKSYSDRWKNTKPGQHNVEVDSGWVDSSRRAVEYAMDPRNFLNNVRIFQFEGLSYDEKTNNKEGIEKILYGTEFYDKIVQYVTSSGNTVTMNSKYSDLILKAGKTSAVSPYHLASRIKQEVGPFLSHASISGTVSGYKGLYNFYNIGATSSSEPMGAIKNGLQYAKDGKGASEQTKTKYLIPWNNKEKAITGGGIFIGSSYINIGQDTVYLQKFHVTSNNGGELFWHQYMTNVLAPYSESKLIYNGYANMNMLNNSMTFIIPVYNNMPETPVENPNILESDFVDDNTKVYADVQTTLNIREGPSSSYEVLTSVDRNIQMTRIAKGKQKGELWDKVKLPNGIVGYVFQSYLKEVPEKQIEKINVKIDKTTINKGETIKLNVEILPEEAKNHEVIYSSNNNNVAQVDGSGNITGIKSGKATITVKAKENNVSSSVNITVYTPVSDVILQEDEIYLQKEEEITIKPIILPTDASNKNISFKSLDTNVVTVTNNGLIKAIEEGTTTIEVKTEEGKITKQVKIIVLGQLEDADIKFSEELKINNNIISGWNTKKLSVSDIKEKITTKFDIEIYNSRGKKLEENEIIGTGSKIRFLENGKVKMEYKVVIYGDVNGDGKINSIDLLVLQRHILEIEQLQGPFLLAGNINKNGKNPSSIDSLLIQRHILELKLIEQ
ncbi:sH3 type 3 domain protein [Clostridium sp. CAG:273]|nr:sH3 type 3 domain protein [Clostridium sp. CAG:273]